MNKFMLILVILLLKTGIASSQCCPYIDSLKIIPENPNTSDSIYLVTNVTYPNVSYFVNIDIENGPDNHITVRDCYYAIDAPALTFINDTINLGVKEAGIYSVNYIGIEGIDPNECMPIDSNSMELTFEVNEISNTDVNGDGEVNILVLGTNSSLNDTDIFSPDQIAEELENILSEDDSITIDVNVVAEDIHMSKDVLLGLGGSGTEYTWKHHSHSLVQYYYWPENLDARMENLSGKGDVEWDYVVISADPSIITNTPGYYSLGVNKVAAKVAEGSAKPLLLMMWPKDETIGASIEHFEEFTYRTADGAKVELAAIPAGLAWDALPDEKKDDASLHPSPNGAYLAAASIYSHICNKNATSSEYIYDNELADVAFSTVTEAQDQIHYSGIRSFISPYRSCDISDETINYNHTGTSSENGIKVAMEWVFNQAPETLQNGGTSPINFNYGRANSNFEANKRYKIDPELFDFSFGFPMQDHGNHGDESMLYGIDRRQSGTMNDTDLGVARFMIEQAELPFGRAIPIRTLYAQMKEITTTQSAYRDSWHMHRDLDKAIASFMYSILTGGDCALGPEPSDETSDEWKTWMAHKIGFETAWNLMYLEGSTPDCDLLVDLDGDGFNSYIDCNDDDADINPIQSEVVYNGIDDDCNELTLDDDLDQDGFALADDCDDNNPNINPDQIEEPYNGIDDDCDESTLDDDLDQDGFLLADDCDDNNPNVNSDQIEEPYNGIDDDCDESTLDDDLDQDGYVLADDCDDNNPNINPDQSEEPYNGIDDDCDVSTLDDDLDQDGFLLADDCDDTNAEINPEAEEIINNGIDEDCDGMDLVTAVHELANLKIMIYPNPASDVINIDVDGLMEFEISLYNLEGKLVKTFYTTTQIKIDTIPSGNYLLEIKDLKTNQKIVQKMVISR